MSITPLVLWIIAGAIQILLQIKFHKRAEWFDYWVLYVALIAQLLSNLTE